MKSPSNADEADPPGADEQTTKAPAKARPAANPGNDPRQHNQHNQEPAHNADAKKPQA
jgi:hypothetical protein